MENTAKMTPEELEDLRKSLTTLGMSDEEVEGYIEKAMKGEHSDSELTVEDKAKKDGEVKENDEPAEKKKEGEEPAEDLEKACGDLKAKKAEIEKAIADIEEKMGKKREEPIEKSLTDDISKSMIEDIQKSLGERIDDIQKSFDDRVIEISKSLTDEFAGKVGELNTIIKGLQEDIKKIGDTPLGTKSVFTKANFFEKGVEDDIEHKEATELSITKDKEDILKAMEDVLSKETDPNAIKMLNDGISDYTVNTVPTNHGIRALAYVSRKKNITLGQ
jgi:hypothetical protein